MKLFELGGAPMSLSRVMAAGRPGTRVSLAATAQAMIAAARRVVERYAAGDEPIYGLNTGLGGNVGFRLSRSEIEAFQVQMVRGRCIGVGEPYPEPVARRMFLCRLIGLAQGGSGISPAVLDLMIAMFNAGLTPVIPGRGSIGAGDLGLCAHLGAAVIGEGEIFVEGRRRGAAEALAAADLKPAILGPKDGLGDPERQRGQLRPCRDGARYAVAVCSTSRPSTAALSLEGYAANPRIFDARLAAARPAAGPDRAPRPCSAVCIAGRSLHAPGAARSIQDALSFRTLSQVYGAVLASFDTAVAARRDRDQCSGRQSPRAGR